MLLPWFEVSNSGLPSLTQDLGSFTNSYASLASSTHDGFVDSIATHSFINRPGPGPQFTPNRWLTSSSTLSFGSLSTNLPLLSIAKILPFTERTFSELNILPRLTWGSLVYSAATFSNRGSILINFALLVVVFIPKPQQPVFSSA